jgi:hypothetical protein
MKLNQFSCSVASDTQLRPPVYQAHRFLLRSIALGVAIVTGIGSPGLQAYAAAVSLGNGGILFDQDTTLESEFVESHGAYQSTFGVLNLDSGEKTPLLIETRPSDRSASIFNPSSKVNDVESVRDFKGSPGVTVTQAIAKYTFKARQNYVFYLESTYNGRPTGIVYSSDLLNPNKEQQVQFTGSPSELCQTGMILSWDDTGARLVRARKQQDRDFDDFIVRVRDTACPIGGGEKVPVQVANTSSAQTAAATSKAGSPFAWGRLLYGVPLLGAFAASGGKSSSGGSSTPTPKNPNPNPTNSSTPSPCPPKNTPCPTPSVPEPITVLGSVSAIGIAEMMRRRNRKRSQQK